jgi:hypothetical protein
VDGQDQEGGEVEFAVVDVPWPKPGDTLYGQGDDWGSIACVEWASGRPDARVLGFRLLAELAAERIAEHRNQDLLVFPFLHSWRHHFELSLKTLIEDACQLLEEEPPTLDTTHSLDTLWGLCRPLLERIEPRAADDLDHAGRVIAELHALDPSGEAFRYHRTRETKTRRAEPTLKGVGNIAVDHFHQTCLGVSNLLDAAAAQIDALGYAAG